MNILLLTNTHNLSRSPLMSFSVAGSHLGHHTLFSYPVPLGSSGLGPAVRFPMFFMTLIVLKTGQVLLQAELQLGFVCCLSQSLYS